jgi:hypothetical protein
MRYAVDPRQQVLFDAAESMFSPMTLAFLRGDWPGLFRGQMLHLMPVRELGEHFHPHLGCPTKELYGMAGVIFLKEFFDLTIEQTVERYLTDAAWQYALNVNPMEASLSHATVERYTKLFVEDDLARGVFDGVTSALIAALELDVSRQRLDSTHIFSDMAIFGRTKLMGVAIKRFLTQLKRHDRVLYEALSEALRSRYAPSQGKLFADFKGQRAVLRQTVAEDLLELVSRFADVESVAKRSTYQAMKRVLEEQCDVVEEQVELKAKTGGNVMQNPSDPDATYDGHKGSGHQAQIAETCGEDNDAQLITGVIPEPAHCPDQEAVEPMLDQLESNDRLPEGLYADTHYGSDENVAAAAERGVDLQSPVSGTSPQDPDALTIDDFVIDEATETVERCPNGCEPLSSEPDAARGVTTTQMRPSDCHACAFASHCPVKNIHGRFVLKHTAKQRRLAARRAEQATQAFRDNYAIRGGGESVNSGLKRRMGMGRLRVRGSPRVRMAVLLRCAGWNLLRALSALKRRGIRDFAGAFAALWLRESTSWCGNRPQRVPGAPITGITAQFPGFPHASAA